jgi:hypothetical protein
MPAHIALSYVNPLPLATLVEQGSSQEYVEQKTAFLDQRDLEILVLNDDQIITRKTVLVDVPAFAKKFIAPKNVLTETDTWLPATSDTTRTYEVAVEAKGVPVTISGTVTLTSIAPSETRIDIAMQADSSVPLVGGKLADFVAKDLRKTVEGERDFSLKWAAAL